MLDQWIVFVSGAGLIDEVLRLPDDLMSIDAANDEVSVSLSLSRSLLHHDITGVSLFLCLRG